MPPHTPAHIVYKEPLVPGDIISIPVQQSQDGRPSDLKPHPWLIIDTIMTSDGPVNRIAPGLDPRNVSVQAGDIVIAEPAQLRDCGISVPVLFRPTVDVYVSAASLQRSR
ncbi:hypothetical protein HCZ30_11935 [Marivivens donghaensis]|uniref:Hedgehog/Intein (Hint) domain-containing protein n=1 Tax=Marivivens donghaensis TaxID=1699413 RepID=A0ABX0W2L8_9RHOB|nr:hypothetical protein [Marivivens donghaensis]NIY73138.1 hypothetical protein [Marivivens donghaensis]